MIQYGEKLTGYMIEDKNVQEMLGVSPQTLDTVSLGQVEFVGNGGESA